MSSNFHPFKDMKESARAQHELDKANFAAVRAESKAAWEEAKLSPKQRQAKVQAKANARTIEAQARIDAAKRARDN